MKKFTAVLLQANTLNHNGRIYSEETLSNMVDQFKVLNQPMYGQLGYPERNVISLHDASHKVNSIFIKTKKLPRKKKKLMKKTGQYKFWSKQNSLLIGEIELLKTPQGDIAKKILEQSVVRPMGTGTVSKNGIIDSYNLISFSIIPKNEDSFKGL